MPNIAGIHHLKFAVRDIEASDAFYRTVLHATRRRELDHRRPDGALFAVLLEIASLGTLLELRLNPDMARAQQGFDPLTLSVATRADLDRWVEHLDACGVERSPILTGLQGWMLAFEDPDQRHIRLYTLETHAWETNPSRDQRWLR